MCLGEAQPQSVGAYAGQGGCGEIYTMRMSTNCLVMWHFQRLSRLRWAGNLIKVDEYPSKRKGRMFWRK